MHLEFKIPAGCCVVSTSRTYILRVYIHMHIIIQCSLFAVMYILLACLTAHTQLPAHRSTPIGSGGAQGSGSKDPELKKHLEAAKRAASALFSGTWYVCVLSPGGGK